MLCCWVQLIASLLALVAIPGRATCTQLQDAVSHAGLLWTVRSLVLPCASALSRVCAQNVPAAVLQEQRAVHAEEARMYSSSAAILQSAAAGAQ
jgi:hypothetical protein